MNFYEKLMGAIIMIDPEDLSEEEGFTIFNLFEEEEYFSEEEERENQRQSWL